MNSDYVYMPVLVLVVAGLIAWMSCRRFFRPAVKAPCKSRRVVEQIVLSAIVLAALLVIAFSTFNAISIGFFRPRDPTPGIIYLIDGHKVHMNCTGTGSPTLMLESGLGNDWLIWGKVQPVLSRSTRVCSYDRAGYGYSDAQPAPRDADHIAAELHSLLLQAHITGPMVLMGHSTGGLFIRDYATRYPDGVVGLIFVDAVTPAWALGKVDAPPKSITRLGITIACSTNWPGLLGACSWPRAGSAPRWKMVTQGLCSPQLCATKPESDSFERSGAETIQTGSYGALPVLIFSHDPAKALGPANWEIAWSRMQEGLKKLSTRSHRIIAIGSTHMIQLERADLIDKEVPLFIEQIRGTAPQPTNYGATTRE